MLAEQLRKSEQATEAGHERLDTVIKIARVLWQPEQLSLNGCLELCRLPDSFGRLSSLQLLDMRRCERVRFWPDQSRQQPKQPASGVCPYKHAAGFRESCP